MADERIISADSHVTIGDEAIHSRLPAKHRESFTEAKMTFDLCSKEHLSIPIDIHPDVSARRYPVDLTSEPR